MVAVFRPPRVECFQPRMWVLQPRSATSGPLGAHRNAQPGEWTPSLTLNFNPGAVEPSCATACPFRQEAVMGRACRSAVSAQLPASSAIGHQLVHCSLRRRAPPDAGPTCPAPAAGSAAPVGPAVAPPFRPAGRAAAPLPPLACAPHRASDQLPRDGGRSLLEAAPEHIRWMRAGASGGGLGHRRRDGVVHPYSKLHEEALRRQELSEAKEFGPVGALKISRRRTFQRLCT